MPAPVVIPPANRLPNGRVIVYSVTTGGRYERLEDQARTLLATGLFRLTKDAVEPTTASPTIGASGHAPAVSVAPRRRGRA
jgi:hypothetical protein